MTITTTKGAFSKIDTLFFKGIGIIMIVIHNYLHFQRGFNLENEETFGRENVYKFLNHIYPIVWTDTFSAFFGFLGHYGVQIFIFFSAYGLAIQFSDKTTYFSFVTKRLKKIYFLLFFGILMFLLFNLLFLQPYPLIKTIRNTIFLSTTYSSFFDKHLYAMFTGPFWFFALMIQIYIAFPFLYRIVKKLDSIKFILLLLLIFGFMGIGQYFTSKSTLSLFGNIFGHFPEVLLGIFMAQNSIKKFSAPVFLISLIVFVGSQFSEFVFPFSFLAMTILLINLIQYLQKFTNKFFTEVVLYTGKISMILFIINGFFRSHPFFNLKDEPILRGERILIYLLILFAVCHFLYLIYDWLTNKLRI
ncbi:Acyltransferase family protein [compost metagenome]